MSQVINFIPYLLKKRPDVVEPLDKACRDCKKETCIGCPIIEETTRRC